MKPRHAMLLLASLLIIIACQDRKKEEAVSAIKQWMGKEILFPKNSVFTIRGTYTIDFALNASDYKIVSYIDTAGKAYHLQIVRGPERSENQKVIFYFSQHLQTLHNDIQKSLTIRLYNTYLNTLNTKRPTFATR